MWRQSALVLTAVLAAGSLPPLAAWCGEPDPWAPEDPKLREDMEEKSEDEIIGDIDDDDLQELNRYWAKHLRRCAMDGLDLAHYAVAGIELRRGNAAGAAAELQKVLKATTSDEVRNLTHLNLAEVYRRRLRDTEAAVKHYLKVQGIRRHWARHYLFTMFAETGEAANAGKLVDELVAQTKEKGEKLALLHRLAALHLKLRMPDQAVAVYRRITEQFTPADMKQLRDVPARQVKEAMEKIDDLRQRDEDDLADDIEDRLEERERELRLARRTDELEVFEKAFEAAKEELRRRERERQRRARDDERADL